MDHAAVKKNNRDRLLSLLQDGAWHSYADCERVGGNRYAARMLELRRLGYVIDDRPSTTDVLGKEYRLDGKGAPQEKKVKAFLTESETVALLQNNLTPGARAALTDALNSYRANKDKL